MLTASDFDSEKKMNILLTVTVLFPYYRTTFYITQDMLGGIT